MSDDISIRDNPPRKEEEKKNLEGKMRSNVITGVMVLVCSPMMLKGLILGGKMGAEWSSSRGIMSTRTSVKV